MRKTIAALTISATLIVTACSTGPRISPADMAPPIPGHLLVHPQDPPRVQRSTDPKTGAASMNGAEAIGSIEGLYDYVGALKTQLDGLIDAVAARDAPPPAKRKRRLF